MLYKGIVDKNKVVGDIDLSLSMLVKTDIFETENNNCYNEFLRLSHGVKVGELG
jgi:hypothetical protein